jgi:hypothetical protein
MIGWPIATALARELENGQNNFLFDRPYLSELIHVYKSGEGNMTHLKFREQLVRGLIVQSHKENTEVHGLPRGRPNSSETLEAKHSLHWPAKGKEHVMCTK